MFDSLRLFCLAAIFAAVVGCDRAERPAAANVGDKKLWHCGMHPQVIQDHPGECPICHMTLTPIVSESGGGATRQGILIDPAVVQNMGVRLERVTRGPLTKRIRTVGFLTIAESGMHDVSLKVGGWIDKLYSDQDGMHVAQGQPLFELYSQDLQVAEQELIAAVKAEKSLEPGASVSIRKDAHGLVESARRKLRLWDVAEQDIDAIAAADEPPKDVPFRSPATGHLEDKAIVQGSAVQAGTKLMRITDHTKMWIDAQVYQEQLAMVRPGQEVIATVNGIAGKTFTGTITFLYPHMDHMTRAMAVRMTVENPQFQLRPGMYASVDIVTQPLSDAVQIPREAVIDTGSRQIVFVTDTPGHFVSRQVQMGIIGDDGNVQILEGLSPGETVVTSGQFLLDVESRTVEATRKLSSPPSMLPAPTTEAAPPPAATASTAAPVLSVVYCSMKKSKWVQLDDTIANPYAGKKMADCGQVKKKTSMPPAGSDLERVIRAYLTVCKELAADNLNATSIQALLDASTKISDVDFAALKATMPPLAGAKTIETARIAFKNVSEQLIAVLPQLSN